MEQKILTRHPEPGKQGASIARDKYDAVRQCIVGALRARKQLTFSELAREAEEALAGRFRGAIPWYVEVVKLDLEARGLIQRVPKTKPELYRLAGPPA